MALLSIQHDLLGLRPGSFPIIELAASLILPGPIIPLALVWTCFL